MVFAVPFVNGKTTCLVQSKKDILYILHIELVTWELQIPKSTAVCFLQNLYNFRAVSYYHTLRKHLHNLQLKRVSEFVLLA